MLPVKNRNVPLCRIQISRTASPATSSGRIEKRTTNGDFPIVGIGASAGGLEALEQFLRQVPQGSGMAFIIVQHLELYGAIEARIKGIVAGSVSSGFWLYKHEPTKWTEIGVLEAWAGIPEWANSYHRGLYKCLPTPEFKDDFWLQGISIKDWHTYRLEWKKDTIKWFVDGVEVSTKVNTYWNQPLNLLLSVQFYPSWLPLPDPSLLPTSMVVDWVKYYKWQ